MPNPADPQSFNRYSYVLNNPLIYIDPSGHAWEIFGYEVDPLDAVQTGLDLVGLVPVIGEPADAINGVIYLARGDELNAALSFGACIPVVGVAATVGKFGKKAYNAVDTGSDIARNLNRANDTRKVVKSADGAAGVGKNTRRTGSLRSRMGDPPSGMKSPQAHHDLPVKFRDRFRGLDINDPVHGRWVEGGPVGDHQRWSKEFNQEWDRFFRENPSASTEQILQLRDSLRMDPRFQ